MLGQGVTSLSTGAVVLGQGVTSLSTGAVVLEQGLTSLSTGLSTVAALTADTSSFAKYDRDKRDMLTLGGKNPTAPVALNNLADGVRNSDAVTVRQLGVTNSNVMRLSTSMATGSDGFLRRWVDVFWTASPRLREWDPRHIGRLYFGVLCVYATFGLTALLLTTGGNLTVYATMLYNYVLGFSCWHVLAVNTLLLPRELRPSVSRRIGLVLAGVDILETTDGLSVIEVNTNAGVADVLALDGRPLAEHHAAAVAAAWARQH